MYLVGCISLCRSRLLVSVVQVWLMGKFIILVVRFYARVHTMLLGVVELLFLKVEVCCLCHASEF